MEKIKVALPYFTGFYESEYENSDTELNIIDEELEALKEYAPIEGISDEDFFVNLEERRKDIAELFCATIKTYMPDFVYSVDFISIDSPKEYNFHTNKIIAEITLNDDWYKKICKYIDENHERLKSIVKEDWSSNESFFSFLDNDIDHWKNLMKEDFNYSEYIITMIAYMMEDCVGDSERIETLIFYNVIEEIYDEKYVSYSDNLKEKLTKMNDNFLS